MINSILQGVPIKSLPPRTASKGKYVYSQSELERFQLTIPDSIAQYVHWLN